MNNSTLQKLSEAQLGATSTRMALHNQNEFCLASQVLAEQTKRQLDIFTFNLDSPLYDQSPFIEATKQLAQKGRNSKIRILLQDNSRVQQTGHRLIQLARRLPSMIEIRRPYDDYIEYEENFLVADEIGYLRRSRFGEYQGETNFYDPLTAGRLSELFSRIWERSEQDTDLRLLNI